MTNPSTVKFYIEPVVQRTGEILAQNHPFLKYWGINQGSQQFSSRCKYLRNPFNLSTITECGGKLDRRMLGANVTTAHNLLQIEFGLTPRTVLSYTDVFNEDKTEEIKYLSRHFQDLFYFYMTLSTLNHPETVFFASPNRQNSYITEEDKRNEKSPYEAQEIPLDEILEELKKRNPKQSNGTDFNPFRRQAAFNELLKNIFRNNPRR